MTMKKNSTKTKPYLYGAYGSNLNMEQMSYRCPNATSVGRYTLNDYQLVFRGVADIQPLKGASLELGLWEITSDCERSLDIYEGFPHFYKKVYEYCVELDRDIMLYIMTERDYVQPPSKYYLESIINGYKDFEIDPMLLAEAVQNSYLQETPYTPPPKPKKKVEYKIRKAHPIDSGWNRFGSNLQRLDFDDDDLKELTEEDGYLGNIYD
jgi:hypothetical protein